MKTIKETWRCVENCGACCNLTPKDRPDLAEYLTPEELEIYLGMVGGDGWCINYEKTTRKCTIYQERPPFCRVQPDTFQEMYGVETREFNDFAIACCRDQISDVYGDDSLEMKQYEEGVRK
jgi:uncharacterized protein